MIRSQNSKRLISHDVHSGTYNYKYTFSVDVVPVCKVFFCFVFLIRKYSFLRLISFSLYKKWLTLKYTRKWMLLFLKLAKLIIF